MNKEVERVRPEYLEPIGKKRSGFPWLLLIGVAVAVLAMLGVRQHMQTRAAWEARFSGEQKKPIEQHQDATDVRAATAIAEERLKRLAMIRKQREIASQQQEEDQEKWRCIGGTPFRKIEGGWENVPGENC